ALFCGRLWPPTKFGKAHPLSGSSSFWLAFPCGSLRLASRNGGGIQAVPKENSINFSAIAGKLLTVAGKMKKNAPQKPGGAAAQTRAATSRIVHAGRMPG